MRQRFWRKLPTLHPEVPVENESPSVARFFLVSRMGVFYFEKGGDPFEKELTERVRYPAVRNDNFAI